MFLRLYRSRLRYQPRARFTTWLVPNASCSSRRISASLGAPGATPSWGVATGPLTAAGGILAALGLGLAGWCGAVIGLLVGSQSSVVLRRHGCDAGGRELLLPRLGE